jgi:eukaryotic-like serine/threonine-protein kinase
MSREAKTTAQMPHRPKAGVDLKSTGEAGLVHVTGLVDEHFVNFGVIAPTIKTLVIDVSGMTRMTSFGVRQWLKAMDAVPKSASDVYLLGCPTFFVDQLNMVLNFGGSARVLSVIAPYTCPSCGMESGETVDILTDRATLAKGGVPEKDCSRCGGKLEFDETPESYFSFVSKYAATSLHPAAAQLLGSLGLYTAVDAVSDKPPRIIKLVHGSVTYFRVVGTIGSMFRARPFLVGAEGEVVVDLAEVVFDQTGLREWRRLLKTLASQVPAVTLVDVTDSFLQQAPDSFALARNIAAATVLVPYACVDCGKLSSRSHDLQTASWPLDLPDQICPTCGGNAQATLREPVLAPLQKAATAIPPASAKLIENRKEVLSRALADASVAQAGDSASSALSDDDTILGKYKIVRRLSAGGMAEVFLAKQVGIGGFEKPVALKRILRQLLEQRHLAVDMFLNEAKIAGRLMHPNIVQVLDVGEEKGALYLAMEYVRGKDLRELLKKLKATRSTMPLEDALHVVREVAQALHHAYWSTDLAGKQLSVVHRDVSPHNVMLGFDGTVKLLDFGVAMSSVTDHSETMIAGKWAYMSPEHTMNQAVDHRSDLFSLGVMMYLMCTGSMPFAGSEPREIVKKIRAGAYKPLEEVAPQVPPAVAQLVSRLLAPNPEHRPATGKEVVAEISEIARMHGLESSTTRISSMLSQMFGDEAQDASIKEILRVTDDKGLAVGSGQTAAQTEADSRRSNSMGRVTPSSPSWGVDKSVSLARRSHEFSSPNTQIPRISSTEISTPVPTRNTPVPTVAPPRVAKTTTSAGGIVRILVIAVIVIGVCVAMYVFVNPTV